MNRFATFWKGPRLSAFEASCLHSFVAAGHTMTLYSFAPVDNVPAGVALADAASIVDESRVDAFIVGGAPSVSHFSDYFRYVMFAKTAQTWVDTDVMLLRDWPQRPQDTLLTLETPTSICNAVMRVSSAAPWLPELIRRTEALMGADMRWGDTGPRLITKLVGNDALIQGARPPGEFYPVHFDDFWKVFLPEHAEECRRWCKDAYTLHLWNNIVDRLGFWKDFMPPQGSFLGDLFIEKGCAPYFQGTFPLKNMKQLVENWQSRQSGQHLGIKSVVRQFVPSIGRTLRHYGA